MLATFPPLAPYNTFQGVKFVLAVQKLRDTVTNFEMFAIAFRSKQLIGLAWMFPASVVAQTATYILPLRFSAQARCEI